MTTTSNNITPIHDELAQAQAAYDSALAKLLKACADFNEGSGKQYAELMQRHADLRGKIAAHEAAAETATLEFKQLLAAANFEKTKAVKEALFKKNDALAIAEELREALADSERTTLPLRASASRAAQTYANAHDMAYAVLISTQK
jgi:pyocin large subunit-like protein